MGKIKVIELTKEQRLELENGYKNGKSHSFRQRCQIILLKSEKRTSVEIKSILGCCAMVVNDWARAATKAKGLKDCKLVPDEDVKQFCKRLMREQVKAAVKENRQRISLAKTELEESLGKEFSMSSLKRFLKKTTDTINELEKG